MGSLIPPDEAASFALDALDRIPPLPAAALKAASLLTRPETTLADAERVVRADEALTAAVLRVANSALYSPADRRTFSLREAMVRLGTRAVLSIALSQRVAPVMKSGGWSYGLERDAMWRAAFGGASVAERIALETRGADAELCFVGALLRDVGKLAIDAMFAERLAAEQFHDTEERPFVEFERQRLGRDHAELGALLVARWGLPEPIARCVRWHHLPPAEPAELAIDIVHCADCVARWAGLGIGNDGLLHPLDPRARDAVGLDRPRVETLAAHAITAVRVLEEDLGGASGHSKERIA